MDSLKVYDNPLVTRYAGREMAELWGPQRKFNTWRRLWVALAEAEHELGLLTADGSKPRIRPAQLAELRAHVDDIDFASADMYERRLRQSENVRSRRRRWSLTQVILRRIDRRGGARSTESG